MSTPDTGIEDTTIRKLTPLEARVVGDVIADSHRDYPSFAYLFPDRTQRTRVLQRLITGLARDAHGFDEVHVAAQGNRIKGAAVWLPPGSFPLTPWRKLKASPSFLPLLWQTRGSTKDFLALGTNAEKTAPSEPHWNLQVLGVRREAQGQGLGSRLLRSVLLRADREGVLCYLETAEPANLKFYQRFGFKVERQHQLIPGGPPHISMRRTPQIHPVSEG